MTPHEALTAYRRAEHASAQAITAAKLAEWQALRDLVTAAGSQQAAATLLGTTQQAVAKRLVKLRRDATPDS